MKGLKHFKELDIAMAEKLGRDFYLTQLRASLKEKLALAEPKEKIELIKEFSERIQNVIDKVGINGKSNISN